MAGLNTARRCPYCAEDFHLGDCPIVATNFKGSEFLPGAKRKLTEFGLPSGTTPIGQLENGWPLMATAPRRASGALARSRASLAGRPGLPAVTDVAPRVDLPARACPHCELPLPYSIDERPAIVIGVVGVNRVGKTHLLATSLTQATRSRGLKRIGARDCSIDEITAKRFREKYYEPLFRRGQILERTQEDEAVRFRPLICNLTLPRQGPLSVILHDVAGEYIAELRDRVKTTPYLRGAKGLIFVVDPREIDSLRPGMPEWVLNRAKEQVAWDQGPLLSECLRADGMIDRGALVPVAIAIAKADLLPAAAGRQLPFLAPAPSREKHAAFVSRIKSTSAQVKRFLEQQEAFDILEPAEEYGRNGDGRVRAGNGTVTFHAFSALGTTPDRNDELGNHVQPLNCIDPLATVLAQLE